MIHNFKVQGSSPIMSARRTISHYLSGPSLSPDNNLLLTEDGELGYELWDTNTHQVIKKFHYAASGNLVNYRFAQLLDDQYLLTGGLDKKTNTYIAGLQDINTGEAKEFYYSIGDFEIRPEAMAVTPDKRCVAIGSSDGHIYLFNLAKVKPGNAQYLQPQSKFLLHNYSVTRLNFSKEGKCLIAGDVSGVKVLDWKSGKALRSYDYFSTTMDIANRQSHIYYGDLSDKGNCVLFPDNARHEYDIFETLTGKLISSLPEKDIDHARLDFGNAFNLGSDKLSEDGKLAVGFQSNSKSIYITSLVRRGDGLYPPSSIIFYSNMYNITTAAYNAKRNELYIGKSFNDAFILNLYTGKIGTLRNFLYDTDTRQGNHEWEKRIIEYEYHDNVHVSGDGNYLLTDDMIPPGNHFEYSYIWDLASRKPIMEISDHQITDDRTLNSLPKIKDGLKWSAQFDPLVAKGFRASIEAEDYRDEFKKKVYHLRLENLKTHTQLLVYPYHDTKVPAGEYAYGAIEHYLINKNLSRAYMTVADGSVVAYDLHTGKRNGRYYFPEVFQIKEDTSFHQVVTAITMDKEEQYLYAAIDPRGRENFIVKFDIKTMKVVQEIHGHESPVTSMTLVPENSLLISVSSDKKAKFWNSANGKLLATMSVSGKEYFINTPEGYYMASKNGLSLFHYVEGKKVYLSQQFDLKFNRPDKVWEVIGSLSPRYLKAFRDAYTKRLAKADLKYSNSQLAELVSAPKITIDPASATVDDQKRVRLRFSCSDSLYVIQKTKIWINGVPLYGYNGVQPSNSKTAHVDVPLELSPGKNEIEIAAVNDHGTESLHELLEVPVAASAEKPNLYLISLGVGKYKNLPNLHFAAKDARDVCAAFYSNKLFGNVITDSLTDLSLTPEKLVAIKQKLRSAGPNDYLIIFYAGHGLKDGKENYFMATSNTSLSNLGGTSISMQDIRELLAAAPSRNKLVLLDACYSGEADPGRDRSKYLKNAEHKKQEMTRGAAGAEELKAGEVDAFDLMKDTFEDIADNSYGATILAATRGYSLADENAALKNGLFTHCLLEGLQDAKADRDGDGKVTLSELRVYLQDNVARLSNGRQKPDSRSENQLNDFRIW